jgi:hypothetical protein
MLRGLAAALRQGTGTAENTQLSTDEFGLELRDTRGSRVVWRIRWDELEEIVAFKRDMFTTDHLCLGFRAHGQTEFHVCDEEVAGWPEVNVVLEARYGIRREQWASRVVKPAFVENWTVLWRDPAAEPVAAPDASRR